MTTPLSRLSKPPETAKDKIDPSIDMKTPPKITVDTMPAAKYFAYVGRCSSCITPHEKNQPIIAGGERIGIEHGKNFDFEKLDPAVKKALESACRTPSSSGVEDPQPSPRVIDSWSLNTDAAPIPAVYYLKAPPWCLR